MANIFLTDICNLHCAYCFANEFVNKKANEISLDHFDKALDFILKDGTCHKVGLIGGEPTLHSKFKVILKKLIENQKVDMVTLYTNGVALQPFMNELCHPKFRILINVNDFDTLPEHVVKQIIENLDELMFRRYMGDRVTLGINMYGKAFQYNYMIDLLLRYHMKRVRTSITVPNIDSMRNCDAHDYFLKMKPQVKKFYQEVLSHGIVPYYDCNKMPSCLLTEEDKTFVYDYLKSNHISVHTAGDNSILSSDVQCSPVVDIMQDLTAVRCFGLSEYTKVNIEDFGGLEELQEYYKGRIDHFAYSTAYSSKCGDCRKRKNLSCMGGCLAFKIKDILELREISEQKIMEKG